MRRIWKIILIVTIFIAITVVCIALFSYYRPREGFQSTTNTPTTPTVIARVNYTGTNAPVKPATGTGTTGLNPIPTTAFDTNNLIFRIISTTGSEPNKITNFQYGLPVTISVTTSVSGKTVPYTGILFAYNHPDIVVHSLDTKTNIGTPFNPYNTADLNTTTVYTITAEYCKINTNIINNPTVCDKNEIFTGTSINVPPTLLNLPQESPDELIAYDTYELYNLPTLVPIVPTQMLPYDINFELGEFDTGAPVPWDYENRAQLPTDVLWGMIHPQCSQEIFNAAYTRTVLGSINNLEQSDDGKWKYPSLMFQRTWSGEDEKKFMAGIQTAEFIVETGNGILSGMICDKIGNLLMKSTRWGTNALKIGENFSDAMEFKRLMIKDYMAQGLTRAEATIGAEAGRAQYLKDLTLMDDLPESSKKAILDATPIPPLDGGANRAESLRLRVQAYQKRASDAVVEYNRNAAAWSGELAFVSDAVTNDTKGLVQKSAKDALAKAGIDDAVMASRRAGVKGVVTKPLSSISAKALFKASEEFLGKLAAKTAGKTAARIASALSYTMLGSSLVFAMCAALGIPYVGMALSIFMDVFVFSCMSFVPAILSSYIPSDAVCPVDTFNIRDAMIKLSGGEIGWQIIGNIPVLGDGLSTFGQYICTDKDGISFLKQPPSIPGYYYDSTLSIFTDPNKGQIDINSKMFYDKRRYLSLGAPDTSQNDNQDYVNQNFIRDPSVWVDYADSRMLDKMAKYYYMMSRRLAMNNNDGTYTFEYISKFYGVIASSKFSCDVQCEITVVTFYATTGVEKSKYIQPVDPEAGLSYHDRRFYFHPIIPKYDNSEAKSPAETFYESKNLPLEGSSTPMPFMTKSARAAAVSDATADFNTNANKIEKKSPAQTAIDGVRNEKGGVNGDLTKLMLDNINRFVVTGCTHMDGTAPSTAETNLEGTNVGDGIMALGDKGGVYYSPSIVATSEYFLSLSSAITDEVTLDFISVSTTSQVNAVFRYTNPLFFVKDETVRGTKYTNGASVSTVYFEGKVTSASTGLVNVAITSVTGLSGSVRSQYYLTPTSRRATVVPPPDKSSCDAQRDAASRVGRGVTSSIPKGTDGVTPISSYILTAPSTTPTAWTTDEFNMYSCKMWKEEALGEVISANQRAGDITIGTITGVIAGAVQVSGIPVGAIVTQGILGANFNPEWSVTSLLACAYADGTGTTGTYIINGLNTTIQIGLNNKYLYINRGPMIGFAPGYTPNLYNLINKPPIKLTQADCTNRTTIRRAVEKYKTVVATEIVKKVLNIQTDATNGKCLYLFESNDRINTATKRKRVALLQHSLTSNIHTFVQDTTSMLTYDLLPDGRFGGGAQGTAAQDNFNLAIQGRDETFSDMPYFVGGVNNWPVSSTTTLADISRRERADQSVLNYTCATPAIYNRLITQFNLKHSLNPRINTDNLGIEVRSPSGQSLDNIPAGNIQPDKSVKCHYKFNVVTRTASNTDSPNVPSYITMVLTPANEPSLALYDLAADNYPIAYTYTPIPQPNKWIDIPEPLPMESTLYRDSCTYQGSAAATTGTAEVVDGSYSTCASLAIIGNIVEKFNRTYDTYKIMKVRKAYNPTVTIGKVCDYEVEMLRTLENRSTLVQKESIRIPIVPSQTDPCLWDFDSTKVNVGSNADSGVSLTNSASIDLLPVPYVWATSLLSNTKTSNNNALLQYMNIGSPLNNVLGILSTSVLSVFRQTTNVYNAIAASHTLGNAYSQCTPVNCRDSNVLQAIIYGYNYDTFPEYPNNHYGAVKRSIYQIRRAGTYDETRCQIEFVEKVDTYGDFTDAPYNITDVQDPNVQFNTRYFLKQYQFTMQQLGNSECTTASPTAKYALKSIYPLASKNELYKLDLSGAAIAIQSDVSIIDTSVSSRLVMGDREINCQNINVLNSVRNAYNALEPAHPNTLVTITSSFNAGPNVCEYTATANHTFQSVISPGQYYQTSNNTTTLVAQWTSYDARAPFNYTNVQMPYVKEFNPANIVPILNENDEYIFTMFGQQIELPYTLYPNTAAVNTRVRTFANPYVAANYS